MRRLLFIERAVLWTGQVGRRAVATTFDVSISHVTSDFHRYREMAPRNLSYDVAEKCFRPTDAFKPLFEAEDPASILSMIAASVTLPSQDRGRLLGFTPSVDVVQALPAAIDQPLLVTVCRAITAGTALDINYQSMVTPEATERFFAPHALIFTGQRWLVRGWDGRHQAYRDLALARILSAASREAGQRLPRDDQWHDRAALEISLIDGLSPGQMEVTAREFGMSRKPDRSFAVRIEPRQAMIPYVLDHLRLRPADHAGQAVPIRLRNYDTVREFDRPGAVG
ncbi:WYL domain-containing protein [Mesorhizobium sp. BR1-1-6]|uniref:WYL domain-containing protein n=1 Tax=Mesorhizobium sp. BR1-1-6 TaxID=2876648 RepID=UPI001CD088B2|nr:WYL domain-containing protein [Mesorhizobium sp. BR1-1-6]MBZ9895561.1 WYL domain-containing protein [Mesorhizobium sp. BR1-1-6]